MKPLPKSASLFNLLRSQEFGGRKECLAMGADFVALDTSMPFDRALLEYLSQRKARF